MVQVEFQNPAQIRSRQEKNFAAMMRHVMAGNRFYQEKYMPLTGERPIGLSDLGSLPFTFRSELVKDQKHHPPFGTNLTFPLSKYTRIHQTAGTSNHPLRWLDTDDSWKWWLECWKEAYEAAEVTAGDRVFVVRSFSPSIGFWAACEAGCQLGALMIPGGDGNRAEQLRMLVDHDSTVMVATPQDALRLWEAARVEGRDLKGNSVRATICAGETRAKPHNGKPKIEAGWGGNRFELAFSTEVGAWAFGCGQRKGLHVIEAEFVVEVVDPTTRERVAANNKGVQRGEIVLTNLRRVGSPLIRYCTGNMAELSREPCPCGRMAALIRPVES